MLDSAAFNRIRRRILKAIAPDFIERKSTYTRHTSTTQIHCLEFGTRRRGGGFCVDIGVHFACAPSFEAFSATSNLQHPQAATCCFQKRWRDTRNEQFFEYGETTDDAENLITQIIQNCLRQLDEIEALWSNGQALLQALPPFVMKSDAAIFKQLLDCGDLQEQERISDSMTIRQLFPGWYPQVSSICILLAFIAKQAGRSDLISDYLSVTNLPGQGHFMIPRVQPLLDTLMS